MVLQENPVFRRVIIPWYDTEAVCLLVVVTMSLVFLFGLAGLAVVKEHPEYDRHLWMALLVIVLSVTVIVSTTVRLVRRYAFRLKSSAPNGNRSSAMGTATDTTAP